MRILFLTPYPKGEAPSQRFRFEQYYPLLQEAGIAYRHQSFISESTWRILYKPGYAFSKALGIGAGFIRRLGMLLQLHRYSCVFIHREASPLGPPLFEWLIAKLWCKPLIYDFDDAIWLPNTTDANRLAARLKFHPKVAAICRWSHTISCGNAYLAAWAGGQTNAKVVINPTTIDTQLHHNQVKSQEGREVVIGWTGTHSTLKYLKELQAVLKSLALEYPQVSFCVISNQPPDFKLPRLHFIPWKKETEIADLLRFHIGLMPLTSDQWSEGKCGFKALQYMALGIPPVISPVGVNNKIVRHGETGYFASSREEWLAYLTILIKDVQLREEMGLQARKAVTEGFSVEANAGNFLALFAAFRGSSTTRAAT
jgi:glycosyltransferase involved in cell wall biosynthesis